MMGNRTYMVYYYTNETPARKGCILIHNCWSRAEASTMAYRVLGKDITIIDVRRQ